MSMPSRNGRTSSSRLCAALVLVSACGASPPVSLDAGRDAPAPDVPPVPLVDITVDLTAPVASFDGRVLVGAFRTSPPTMPPVASVRLGGGTPPMAVTFPTTATLRDVEPGTYFILGVLDYDPPSPTLPGSEDATAMVGPLTVDGTSDLNVDLALAAPTAGP